MERITSSSQPDFLDGRLPKTWWDGPCKVISIRSRVPAQSEAGGGWREITWLFAMRKSPSKNRPESQELTAGAVQGWQREHDGMFLELQSLKVSVSAEEEVFVAALSNHF